MPAPEPASVGWGEPLDGLPAPPLGGCVDAVCRGLSIKDMMLLLLLGGGGERVIDATLAGEGLGQNMHVLHN